jgi:hypothetical protein
MIVIIRMLLLLPSGRKILHLPTISCPPPAVGFVSYLRKGIIFSMVNNYPVLIIACPSRMKQMSYDIELLGVKC